MRDKQQTQVLNLFYVAKINTIFCVGMKLYVV